MCCERVKGEVYLLQRTVFDMVGFYVMMWSCFNWKREIKNSKGMVLLWGNNSKWRGWRCARGSERYNLEPLSEFRHFGGLFGWYEGEVFTWHIFYITFQINTLYEVGFINFKNIYITFLLVNVNGMFIKITKLKTSSFIELISTSSCDTLILVYLGLFRYSILVESCCEQNFYV